MILQRSYQCMNKMSDRKCSRLNTIVRLTPDIHLNPSSVCNLTEGIYMRQFSHKLNSWQSPSPETGVSCERNLEKCFSLLSSLEMVCVCVSGKNEVK